MNKIRGHLTYANVMSSLAVFLILGGATAFAAVKKIGANEIKANSIKTGKIVKEAVTEGKIKNASVTASKLGNGAVTGDKIADNAVSTNKIADKAVTGAKINLPTLGTVPSATNATNATNAQTAQSVAPGAFGVALAGVNVNSDGSINSWFNRLGGKPTITVGETSRYDITFPGITIETDGLNVVGSGTIRAAIFGGQITISGIEGKARVRTANATGVAAALPFNYIVYGAQK